ncbi:MAG: HAD-IA family hydrolase, partial [Clostridia bacterium]|nr:HAD-IA family hydrolase [Clostridia bacterium]
DAEIYHTLMERYGFAADRAVFIDDTLKNVEGAMKVGIHGFHMHEKGMLDRFFI